MRKQLLLSFLPWILFSALFGKTENEMLISILVATAVFIKIERYHLARGFILSWGTLLFFVFIFVLSIIFKNAWVIDNAGFLANVTLAIIAWCSLAIGKPFTLQYAYEQTPKQVWSKPGFIKVNQILTSVWGGIFAFSAVLHCISFGKFTSDKIIYQILMYGSIALSVWFTSKFPIWYRTRQQII